MAATPDTSPSKAGSGAGSFRRNSFKMNSLEELRRIEVAQRFFAKWDLDGNGFVSYTELQQILQATQRISNKAQKKWIIKFENKLKQDALQDGFEGEPMLDPPAFANFISGLTAKDAPAEFDEFMKLCERAVKEATETTVSTKQKQEVWEIFHMLDVNHDGVVDFSELQVLFQAENKKDKKNLLRWQHRLRQITAEREAANQQAAPETTEIVDELTNTQVLENLPQPTEKELCLSLADFQQFVREFTEGDESRLIPLLENIRDCLQKRHIDYIVSHKVHEIINEIMEDLLLMQPKDVLGGIQYSVNRLQRLKASHDHVPSNNSPDPKPAAK